MTRTLVPSSLRRSHIRRRGGRSVCRPFGAWRLPPSATQGLRLGLQTIAPPGLRTTETREPEMGRVRIDVRMMIGLVAIAGSFGVFGVATSVARAADATFLSAHQMFERLARRAPPAYWAADGVHPTLAGHAAIANRWLRAVRL